MLDPRLMSYVGAMKKQFWHERQHLQPDEVKRQWAASAAPLTSFLLDPESHAPPLEPTSVQAPRVARQSSSMSWADAAMRRRGSVRTLLHLPLSSLKGLTLE